MATEFVDLKQAAKMLGVTPEALVEMRSQGEVYAYRDGSTWKFKMQELERVAQERGISLAASDAGAAAGSSGSGTEMFSDSIDSELDLSKPLMGGSDAPSQDKAAGKAAGKAADKAAGDSSVADLFAADLEEGLDHDSDADSLLVSSEAMGQMGETSSSTIIGGQDSGAPNPDSDLQLIADDSSADVLDDPLTLAGSGGSSILTDELSSPASSGVKLIPDADESGVKLVADSSDELLVDNSDILNLSPETGTGDLELSPGSGTGDLEIDSDLALDSSDVDGLDDLSLSDGDEDDLVLDGSGSDVTLGAGDTGINLTSASDSGLSLDEDPIELSGSISSLELPDADDADIINLEDVADQDAATQLKQDEEFLLSPAGDANDDDDSGSQVIALEDSAFDQDAATMLGGDMFAPTTPTPQAQQQAPGVGAGDMMAAAMGGVPGAGAQQPASFGATQPAPAAAAEVEKPYSIWNVLTLLSVTGVLALSGMIMVDVIRHMWTFDPSAPQMTTSITDALLSALKMK